MSDKRKTLSLDNGQDRTSREDDSRNDDMRADDSWQPASILPTPKPQDGWVFRWVRTSSLGNADNTNVSKKLREGWIPVLASDHTDLHVMSDIESRFEGNIEVGGLLLCKAPAEDIQKRREYHNRVATQQMDSVDRSYLSENDPRMPLLDPSRKSRSEFRKG